MRQPHCARLFFGAISRSEFSLLLTKTLRPQSYPNSLGSSRFNNHTYRTRDGLPVSAIHNGLIPGNAFGLRRRRHRLG